MATGVTIRNRSGQVVSTNGVSSSGSAAQQKAKNSAAIKASRSGGGSSNDKAKVQGLSDQLNGLINQANSLGIDTTTASDTLNKAKNQFGITTVNSTNLATNPLINLPNAPTTKDVGSVVTANNAGLATILGSQGYSLDQNGMFVSAPSVAGTSADQSGQANIFKEYLANKLAPPSTEDIYNKAYKESGVGQAQKDVNNYTAQLNSIVAKQNADLLRVRGTDSANGVTEAVYGGQAATINREAAISALPVQAQLAAAQGNLEMAQKHLDTLYQIRSQDATAQYQYKSNLLDSVYNFATAQEKTRIDNLKTQEDRTYQAKQDFLATQSKALSNALAQGAPSSVINAINSATDKNAVIAAAGLYNGDVLDRQLKQAQLRKVNQDIQATIDAGKPITVVDNPSKTGIQNNMSTLGEIFKSSKVSAGNKTVIGNGLSLAQAAADLADANSSGAFAGLYPGRGVADFFLPEWMKRQSTVKNEALISALDLQTQFWASGAALSEGQTKLVQSFIPTKSDNDKTIRTKTNNLVNYMLSQTSAKLLTDGIEYQPAKVDLFETQTLLGKMSPEQQQELQNLGLLN
jgi:hypothetical protein